MIESILPNAVASDDGWTVSGAANEALACRSDDGGTSYMEATGGGKTIVLDHDDTSVPAASIDANPTVSQKGSLVVNGCVPPDPEGSQFYLRLSGNDSGAQNNTVTDGSTFGYTLVTSAGLARPGGGSYTGSDVPNLQSKHVAPVCSTGTTFRVSYAYITLSYTPVAGGFGGLVGQFLGPLAGLLLSEMPKMAGALYRARRILLIPTELELAWREYKALPHRRFAF